ncbi:MAG: methyltransferase type 11 [Bacteroidia bacterium]|nr:methyltransferase type 11 [Bacteroidia bacterium]
MNRNIHYGCGLSAPESWENYDVSPSLRLKSIPILGSLVKVEWQPNVKYGNIIKGIAPDNSAAFAYCSHVLEHLSLNDCRKAIKNTYMMLGEAGVFRLVVPDLKRLTELYLESGDSVAFIKDTLLGTENRMRGFKGVIHHLLSNRNHLWMWDYESLAKELESVGFKEVRRASFNDSSHEIFKEVEEASRFENALAIEAIK